MSLRVIIVGTGGMANFHAETFSKIDGVEIVAGIDTNADRLSTFCEKHGIPHGFSNLEEALAWGEFDAATNVTPDSVHYMTTMPLLAAGKHVLCEKPLATDYAQALEMAQAAQKAGVVNMINLTYRNGACLSHAAKLIAEGAIGEVRHFEASYLQSWLTQPAWGEWSTESTWLWRLSTAHGSKGVLGDVGVHILDFATFAAGSEVSDMSCRLVTFDKAEGGKIGEYVLDANDSMSMHVRLGNGAMGVIHASRFATGHFNDLSLRIFGTKGAIEVKDVKNVSSMRVCLGDDIHGPNWTEVEAPRTPSIIEKFVDAIRTGKAAEPDFARGAALQKALDTAVDSDAQNGLSLSV